MIEANPHYDIHFQQRLYRYVQPKKDGTYKCSDDVLKLYGTKDGRHPAFIIFEIVLGTFFAVPQEKGLTPYPLGSIVLARSTLEGNAPEDWMREIHGCPCPKVDSHC